MTRLTQPPQELVERLKQEVEYDKRIVGLVMNPMSGGAERPLYSVQDACNFLYMDSVAEINDPGSKDTVHYIDLTLLQRWLREVFGDDELADAIRTVVAKEDYYGKQLPGVKALLKERLSQCNIA